MPSEPAQNGGWGFGVTGAVMGVGLAAAATYIMFERGASNGVEFGLVWFGGLALILVWFTLSGRKSR